MHQKSLILRLLIKKIVNTETWIHRDENYLIRDIEAAIEADEPANRIMFAILLSLSAMGIFNAQVLSIFKRGKEIGTLMALGMTRSKVVGLFTLEGGINAVLASPNFFLRFSVVNLYMKYINQPMAIAARVANPYWFNISIIDINLS